jgi:hypothetical protein
MENVMFYFFLFSPLLNSVIVEPEKTKAHQGCRADNYYYYYYYYYYALRSQHNLGGIVTCVWTGRPRNRTSIPGRDEKLPPESPGLTWSYPNLYSVGVGGSVL